MTEESFLRSGRLALDTEFVWTKTYYARLGLVQAAASGGLDIDAALPLAAIPFRAKDGAEARARLYDPLRSDPAPLGAALASEGTVKLLHDAHQDLQHLARWTGCAAPRSVFDTRVAAGFCGPRGISYIYGLGGRDVRVESIQKVFAELEQIASTGVTGETYRYLEVRE